MTEVQGEMSDLIALIAHPEEMLARSNAQHRRLVTLLREGDGQRAAALMRKHVRGTEHILAGLCDRVLRARAEDCSPSAKFGADTAWSSSAAAPRKHVRKRLTAVRTHA